MDLMERNEAAELAGLPQWELDRAHRRGALRPCVDLPGKHGRIRLYSAADLALARLLGALRAAGVRLVDAGAVLRQLQAMPDGDRRQFLEQGVLARFPASRRFDFFDCAAHVPDGAAEVLPLAELSS